jgi:hypothetical protein
MLGDDDPDTREAHLPAEWRPPRRVRLAAALGRRRTAPADLDAALSRLAAAQRAIEDRIDHRIALDVLDEAGLRDHYERLRAAARRARITRTDQHP